MESAQKKVLVPVACGSEEMEVVTLIDVFRVAGANVTVASVEARLQVECSNRVKLVADTFIADCAFQIFDLVALPGGMPGSERLRDCKVLQNLTEAQSKDGRFYGAMSEAPAVVLETWGLLKGLRATCHWQFLDQLSSPIAIDSNIQIDGVVTTSKGPGIALEFALSLAEQLYGREKLEEVLLMFMVPKGWNECEEEKHEYNVEDWSLEKIPQVLVPVANGSNVMEAVMVVDVLRRAKADVIVASVEESLEILAARGSKIVADHFLEDICNSTYDLILLPGGRHGPERLGMSEHLVKLLRKQADSRKVYGAVCGSAVMLDSKGLLKGRKATTHPHHSARLTDQTAVNVRVVIDGNVITSRGPGSSLEFALTIVEKVLGLESAIRVAEDLVFPCSWAHGSTC